MVPSTRVTNPLLHFVFLRVLGDLAVHSLWFQLCLVGERERGIPSKGGTTCFTPPPGSGNAMAMHLLRLRTFFMIAAAAATLGFAACKSTKAGGAGGSSAGGTDGDYVNGTSLGTPLPDRQEGVSFMSSNVDRSQFPPVFFGFDSFSVPGGERGKLQAVADFAKANNSTIIIAGFTDERGTPEYNRGLGERRAQTVREDLIAMGVSGGQLQTVSFGEEMPSDSGGGDGAWARNRRAEFGVVR